MLRSFEFFDINVEIIINTSIFFWNYIDSEFYIDRLHIFSFQCKVICIQSLFALCSIGLLKNDMKLINAVFKELETLKESAYKFDIVKLKSIYYSLQVKFFILLMRR